MGGHGRSYYKHTEDSFIEYQLEIIKLDMIIHVYHITNERAQWCMGRGSLEPHKDSLTIISHHLFHELSLYYYMNWHSLLFGENQGQ